MFICWDSLINFSNSQFGKEHQIINFLFLKMNWIVDVGGYSNDCKLYFRVLIKKLHWNGWELVYFDFIVMKGVEFLKNIVNSSYSKIYN